MSLTIASETLALSQLNTSLNRWVNDNSIEGQKLVAAEFIRNAYQSQQTNLDLSSLGLTKLPSCLGMLVKLKRFDVHSNKLKKLPSTLGDITELQELRVHDNLLEKLPSSLKKLTQLTLLNATSNQISKLPKEIGELTSLQTLNVRSNKLKKIPKQICNLVHLQALVVASNKLEKLPKHFSRLQKLRTLNIGDNKFHKVPNEIYSITELEELYLYENKLNKLSSKVRRLANLKSIHLEKCGFQEWPNVLCELSSLKAISLRNNNIRQVSFGIYWLKQLERLSLEGNKELAKLPLSMLQLPELRKLDVDDTMISKESRDKVLEACKFKRDSDPEVFETRLILWEQIVDTTFNSEKMVKLTLSERSIMNEWLRRLEETKDFQYHQKDLVEVVCNIVADVLEDEGFKQFFLNQAVLSNSKRENFATVSLNEIYTIWKIWFMSEKDLLKDKLKIMLQAAKTIALRNAVELNIKEFVDVHELSEKETVDVYLYYEILLKEELELLTFIKTVTHNNPRSWVDTEQLKERVEKTYLDFLIAMPIFHKFAEGTEDFQAIWRPQEESYTEALEELQVNGDHDLFAISANELRNEMVLMKFDTMRAWVKIIAGLG